MGNKYSVVTVSNEDLPAGQDWLLIEHDGGMITLAMRQAAVALTGGDRRVLGGVSHADAAPLLNTSAPAASAARHRLGSTGRC